MINKCFQCGRKREADQINGVFICNECQEMKQNEAEKKIFNELIEQDIRPPADTKFQEHYRKGVDNEVNWGAGKYERERRGR